MSEIWLRPNRRALWFGMIPPALAIVLGALLVLSQPQQVPVLVKTAGVLLAVAGGLLLLGLGLQSVRPRLALDGTFVAFYLRSGPPVRVPLKFVEAFFLGQGPAQLTSQPDRDAETINLVARLAERAEDWKRIEVKPALGQWCDGYVTIRGTWCDPLTEELTRRLNRQLADAKRNQTTT